MVIDFPITQLLITDNLSDGDRAACSLNQTQGPMISFFGAGSYKKDGMKSHLNFHLYFRNKGASRTE